MHLGDTIPPVLAAYYDAVDNGRFDEATALFAGGARYAVPRTGEVETSPRTDLVGPAAIRARFADRGKQPYRHVVLLAAVEGPDTLLEGVTVDEAGAPIATYVSSVHVDDDGLIDRMLAFACAGARDPIPTHLDGAPADAAKVVHEYFADLDDGRFPEAASRFSDDVLYSHPPYKHTGIDDPGRVEFRGRVALLAAFERRGKTSFDHDVVTSIQRGPHCIFEGVVRNVPGGDGGSFISSLSLAADGTIGRYVSFYCEPGVPVA